MTQRLFGVEVEYGFAALDPTRPEDMRMPLQSLALDSLLRHARQQLVHLPGSHSAGLFLENGSRLYVDCHHPEAASPEVDHPTDCCRYVHANDAILRQLVGDLRLPEAPRARFVLWKGNVDYAQPSVTYGCHESYLHAANPALLPRQLIPHLVSRVYLASGGLDPACPGIRFSLFPRARYFQRDISSSSTSGDRGIYHTRQESHASANFHRCHVICGDSTILGLWLKTATTAMIVALVEAGLDPGSAVYPKDPVRALQTFSADPTFHAQAELTNGRQATALDIQLHYAAFVESHLGHPSLPPWAQEACRVWRHTLALAAQGPAAMARSMDWAIKLALSETRLRQRGFQPENLAPFNHVLETFQQVLAAKKAAQTLTSRSCETLFVGPLADCLPAMRTYLADHGASLDALPDFLALRWELCEIDSLFSQLAPDQGLCEQLTPHLRPIAPLPENIPAAQVDPPAATRAAIRGRYIRRYAKRRHYTAEWTEIRRANGRRLDLSHPFGQNVRWAAIPVDPPDEDPFQVDRLFRSGRYAEVLILLPLEAATTVEELETYVLASARSGASSQTQSGLDRYQRAEPSRFAVIALSLCALASLGLAPAVSRMLPLIAEGDRLLQAGQTPDEYHALLFAQNKGRALSAAGRHDEAVAVLRAELASPRAQGRPRNRSRTQLYLAEALRCQGHADEASLLLHAATETYQQENLLGDLADYALPLTAKLSPSTRAARKALDQAAAIQLEHHNELGLARILCLKARRLAVKHDLPQIWQLVDRVEALHTCPTAARVLDQFDQWANPDRPGSTLLDYWGL